MPDAGSAFTALKPRVYIAPHRHTSHDARSRDLREIVVFPRDCGVSLYLIYISRKCLRRVYCACHHFLPFPPAWDPVSLTERERRNSRSGTAFIFTHLLS